MRPVLIWTFLGCLLGACFGVAERLPVRVITSADGLVRDDLHAVIQDHLGRMWFATSEGVSRYDGEKFQSFRVADGVPGRDVHDILEARDGTVWIASSGGMARFNPKVGESVPRFVPYPLTAVQGGVDRAIEDQDGDLWAGSYLGLFRFHPNDRAGPIERFDLITKNGESLFSRAVAGAPDPHRPVYAIFEDSARTMWIGTSDGLFAGPDCANKGFARVREIGSIAVNSIAEDTGHKLWIGTQSGLLAAEFHPTEGRLQIVHRYTTRDGLPDDLIRTVLVTPDGKLWIATNSGLARQVSPDSSGKSFKAYEVTPGLRFGNINKLSLDADGNLWIATDGGGAIKITAGGFITFDQRDGFVPAYVGSLTLDRQGQVLALATTRDALVVYKSSGTHFTAYRMHGPPGFHPEDWIPWHQMLLETKAGNWYMASYQGLLEYSHPNARGGVLSPNRIIGRSSGLPDKEILSLLEDSRQQLWIGTFSGSVWDSYFGRRAGVSVLAPGAAYVHRLTENDGLPPLDSFLPRAVFEDRAGQIWLGLHRTGVARFRDGRFQIFTEKDGVPFGGIRQIYQDGRGHLWLASTSGGLGEVEDTLADKLDIRRFTTREGLSSDEIQTITEDSWGRIYAGTGLGVDRLDPQNGRIRHFTAADGLPPGEVEDSVRDRNGDLWFGTLTGLSRLTPQPDAPVLPVPSRIMGLLVAGRSQVIEDGGAARYALANLGPGQNNIEIDYACSPRAQPCVYQYRLEGSSGAQWSATTASRTVLFGNLRDGHYRFLVRAVNIDGVPGEAAEVTFRILPPVWIRWWFIASVLLVLLASCALAYRYRVSHLLEIERMRTRLACDIHDDVSSAISRIVIISDAAQRKGADAAHGVLALVSEASREILENIGDMIAAVNPQHDRWEDAVSRMREFGAQIFDARDVRFELRTNGVPLQGKVRPETLRHLYLIFKELVNNAAKHSECTRATGSLHTEGGHLILELSDNGKGFDGCPKAGRNGISNLQKRAAALNGDIEWVRHDGTTVKLRIPLHSYAGRRS